MRSPTVMLCSAFLLLSACGESDADKATRSALAPLIQRSQALTAEIANAEKTHAHETWGNEFDRVDGYVKDKADIQKELRGIVPTPKYACVLGVFARGLSDDIAELQSRVAGFRQRFKASNEIDNMRREIREGRQSEYAGSTYFNLAKESYAEALAADSSADRFLAAADSISRSALSRADTLRYLTLKLKLLPVYDTPVYPIFSDTAHKSIRGMDLGNVVCK